MDSSHKTTFSNYPSVFTVLPRVTMFKIHPVLLSTEQPDFRRQRSGTGKGEALLLPLNCCWQGNTFMVSMKSKKNCC